MMANTIKIRRGVSSSLPVLNNGELAFAADTKELFIGDGIKNYKVGCNIKRQSGRLRAISYSTNTLFFSIPISYDNASAIISNPTFITTPILLDINGNQITTGFTFNISQMVSPFSDIVIQANKNMHGLTDAVLAYNITYTC